ncbi:phosphoribosyl transferase [Cupriavidus sp. USMAA2-4]|uniref:Phosphoribosyl transferase n=1 Tax=Cupriavidus malaysiensis TaxID=367825 RepID=A0ABM6FGI4_9BURK|nr:MULTISPECIES: phosphoribosyltransferase family protein [Cupriavidus]AOY97076.1 phosphoribosyl transferase [Cupriavidus sp. USMAA2-4]AOZ03870.1 phosphoribosyl transferase [Cupriavidus sp. USMAHM13]AOZ11054.1 phosphoribosyl transferase [Cupriavidus malaysiensis]
MRFVDRQDAAAQLADALGHYRGQRALVLALPRGGVPLGRVLADALQADLDVVLVRKLGAPGDPEFALGAVAEDGWTYLAPYAEPTAGSAYLERVRAEELERIRQRRARYTPGRAAAPSAAGRVAIVVDDGLATGATMIAALHAVRAQAPARLVCAVPVAAPDGLREVQAYADEVVCLYAPAGFQAVGHHYLSFPQVSDEEVVDCLAGRA